MKIVVDAMGGDNAPLEIVKGAAMASREYDARLVLVGDENRIREILAETDADMTRIEVMNAGSVVSMEDDPTDVVRSKKDSSMAVGLRLVRDEADAFVSAGNSGALHIGGSLYVRPLKGIKRAALATLLPFEKPVLLLDSGANVNIEPDYLVSWGLMGSIYMKNVMGVDDPRVGLLNNGTEEHKGTETQITAYRLLSEDKRIRFAGNIEAKAVMSAPCDVLVTDGFTGNVFLKTVEGLSKHFLKLLKSVYMDSVGTKVGYLFVKNKLSGLKSSFDTSEYGGAPLLGIQKPVIKAHGSSDAVAIKNAIRQAVRFCDTKVIEKIQNGLSEVMQ